MASPEQQKNNIWFGASRRRKTVVLGIIGVLADGAAGAPFGSFLMAFLFPFNVLIALMNTIKFLVGVVADPSLIGNLAVATSQVALAFIFNPVALATELIGFVVIVYVGQWLWTATSRFSSRVRSTAAFRG